MKSSWWKSSPVKAVAGRPEASVAIRWVTGGCEAYTVSKQVAMIQPRNRSNCDDDAALSAEGVSGTPVCEVWLGSPGSLARDMLAKGLSVNPGELPASPQFGHPVA